MGVWPEVYTERRPHCRCAGDNPDMPRPILAVPPLVLLLLAAPLSAQPPAVRGEVVDLECHVARGPGGRGEAHAACAMSCARKGNRMGLLSDDAVYEIVGDYAANGNAKLLDFVARRVEAKGQISDRDGTLRITVASMAVVKDDQ
jgi:hypothetical protein